MSNLIDILHPATVPLWHFPIKNCHFIPLAPHPGGFGKQRKHDIHTGIDLYTTPNAPIYACENGIVTAIIPFTGLKVNMPWWNETDAILIKGASGTLLYGECKSTIAVGQIITAGQIIGEVIPVLPSHKHRTDVPNHSTSMLHLEWYKEEFSNWDFWLDINTPPPGLLNPTLPLQKALLNYKA